MNDILLKNYEAFRYAIRFQILNFKKTQIQPDGTYICAITKKRLSKEEIHVDHHIDDTKENGNAFALLVRKFCKENNLDIEKTLYVEGKIILIKNHPTYKNILSNDELNKIWQNYHLEFIKNNGLRIISKTDNLKKAKSSYTPTFLENRKNYNIKTKKYNNYWKKYWINKRGLEKERLERIDFK